MLGLMRRRLAPVVLIAVFALLAPRPLGSAARPHGAPRRCDVEAPADRAAKELARTASTTAETIAIDHGSSYAYTTLSRIREYAPSVPITRAQARKGGEGAWLLAAAGTANSYSVTAVAADGDGYVLDRLPEGEIVRRGAVCGRQVGW